MTRGSGEQVVGIRALGSVIGVRVHSPARAEALARVWEACRAGEGAQPAVVLTDEDRDLPDDRALEVLTQRITVEAISRQAGRLLMLHACALARADGRTAVLVGPSGAGKTTMAAAQGWRWGYVTDETVAFDEHGILAFPKPLSIARAGRPKQQVSPARLGLAPAPADLRATRVLMLDRDPGYDGVEVSSVPLALGVVTLAEHTSYLAALDRPLARLGALLEGVGGLRRLRYGSAEAVGPALEALMDHDVSMEPTPCDALSPQAVAPAPTAPVVIGGGRGGDGAFLRRAPLLDELRLPGARVVMTPDGTVLALSALAGSVLDALADGQSDLSRVHAFVVERFGPPPDDEHELASTGRIVAQLIELGIIRHGT